MHLSGDVAQTSRADSLHGRGGTREDKIRSHAFDHMPDVISCLEQKFLYETRKKNSKEVGTSVIYDNATEGGGEETARQKEIHRPIRL